jgi:hypothetical protein
MGEWHLWLGSGKKGLRCVVCGSRWLVFRYTNGDMDVSACWRHRRAIPGRHWGRGGITSE